MCSTCLLTGKIVVIIFLTIIELCWLNKEEETDETRSFSNIDFGQMQQA